MKTLLKNTGLIFNLTKRDVESRYRGTSLGIVWSLLNPVIMLSIYSFIFGFGVFKAEGADNDRELHVDYVYRSTDAWFYC